MEDQDQQQIPTPEPADVPSTTTPVTEGGFNYQEIVQLIIELSGKIAIAIAIIVIGFWLTKKLLKIVEISLKKAKLSPEVNSFLISLLNAVIKLFILLAAAGQVGIELTSLVAVLAAAGFAIGMALQGSLGNFAAGIMIMVFKPYKLDDWIEVCDRFGRVESIQIFNTTIVTPGQKTHIIPNGQVMDGVITNFSNKGHIRLELNVSMPYAESFPKVKAIILDALKQVPEILQTPVPEVGIETYDSHNIIIAVRPFIQPDDFWKATYDCHEAIKKAFYENNIKMAYSEGIELGSIGE